MQVTYTTAARKQMRKMPAKDRAALMAKLAVYAETGAGDVKQLVNRSEYRLRHGQWRAFFELDGGVIVVKVAHRREAYR